MHKSLGLILVAAIIVGAVSILPQYDVPIVAAEALPVEIAGNRTATSKLYKMPDGTMQIVVTGALHYQDDGWQEINNAWVPAVAPWSWQMERDSYHAYALSTFSSGQILKFEYQGSDVRFQPMALEWLGLYGGISQISMPESVGANIINTPQEPVEGMNTYTGAIRWVNGYGSGRHFQWNATPGRLEKLLTLQTAPPTPPQYMIDQGGINLRLNFIFAPSSDLSIYVDGVQWNKSSTVTTAGSIQFRQGEETVWHFTPVGYWDSSGSNEVYTGITTLRKSGGSLYVSVQVPYEWLQQAVYPVYIDPTISVQGDADCKDNYISSGAPTSNYGTGQVAFAGYTASGNIIRILAEFPVDWGVAGDDAVITDATLSLYAYSYTGSADTYYANRLLRLDWAETESTWNIYKTGSNWGTAGAAGATDITSVDVATLSNVSGAGWKEWDITGQAEWAYANDKNVAVRVAGATTSGSISKYMSVRSREYSTDPSLRPKLVITYIVPPSTTILSATSITSTTARINAEVLDDGGAVCEGRFSWGKIETEDDFEWGSDGDPLSDDGGGIDWTILVTGINKVEIDTAQQYGGTRSARVYKGVAGNCQGYFSQSPLSSSQVISFRFRKDTDAEVRCYHGDGTYQVYVNVRNDEHVYYYDGSYHATGTTISINTWYLMEIRNVNWVAHTYDIYLEGFLIQSGAAMRASSTFNNLVAFETYALGEMWIDNVRILANRTTTAWDGGSYSTDDPFYSDLSSLTSGARHVYEAQNKNSAGEGAWSGEATFLTCPAAPTNVAATDGVHTDKVVVTWTKSDGATGYKVYEGSNLLDTLGDVATYDDTAAPAPTITPGATVASDGSSTAHAALSLSGTSANNGASRTYKVVAFNDSGDSPDSATDAGYRGVGPLTYQWQRSAADSDASYSNIDGATSSTYDDTGAPQGTITPGTAVATDGSSSLHVSLSLTGTSTSDGAGRYYRCVLNAEGATEQTSAPDRGYRTVGSLTYQWQRSAADSDADYGDIVGATTATYDDTEAPSPTITPGSADASDGTSTAHVTLTLSGHTGNDGDGRYFQCVLDAAGAVSETATPDRGYRGTDSLTLQWLRSLADSDADYSEIAGATATPYNDTGGAIDPDGRYYRAVVSMSGADDADSASDRGYRLAIVPPTVVSYNATDITSDSAELHGEITDTGNEDCSLVGFEWGMSSGNYSGNWTDTGAFGLGTFDHVIAGLPYNTEVFWRAFAENAAGFGYSSERSFWTLAICHAPTDFAITQVGPASINVTWTMGIGADRTIIRVSEDGYPDTITGGYLAYNGTETYVLIEGLSLSTAVYYFRAWSENEAGVSADYAQARIGTVSGIEALLEFLIPLIDGPVGIVNMMFALALMGFAFWKTGWLRVTFSASLVIWGAATVPHDMKIAAPFIAVGTVLLLMAIFQLISGYRKDKGEVAWAR